MNHIGTGILIFASFILLGGCGSSEPTVIQPTETYELNAQEQKNAEREAAALREQRQ